jgi:hypothetical protein
MALPETTLKEIETLLKPEGTFIHQTESIIHEMGADEHE